MTHETLALKGFTQKDFNSLLKVLAVAILKTRGAKVLDIKKSVLKPSDKTAMLKVTTTLGIEDTLPTAIFDGLIKKGLKEQTSAFAPVLRKAINSNRLNHDTDAMTAGQREILPAILTLLAKPDSANAFANLQKKIGALGARDLSTAYIGAVQESFKGEDASTIAAEIRKVVKQLTKKDGMTLTTEEQKKFRANAKTAALIKQWTALRNKLKIANQTVIRSAVAASGKDFILLKDLAKYMKSNGIKETTLHPELFKSKFIGVNINGELVDNRGVKLVGGGNIANHKTKVVVNPTYAPKAGTRGNNWIYYIETVNETTGAKSINRAQPEDVVAARRDDKFTRVSIETDKLDKIKAKWRGKMKLNAKDIEAPEVVYPFFLEFLYQTASRVGSKETGSSAGAATYGASNFLVKHILKGKTGTGSVLLKYPVKAGKLQEFLLDGGESDAGDAKYLKMLSAFIKKKAAGKKPTDVVWTVNGKRMNTQLFAAAVKEMGVPFKPHDFRSLRGTEIASAELPKALTKLRALQKKAAGKAVPVADVHKLFEAAIAQVGAKLGHVRRAGGAESVTPTTAISFYVSPQLMVNWYKEAGYAPNTKVVKAAQKSGIKV